jgi:hypothetical protein
MRHPPIRRSLFASLVTVWLLVAAAQPSAAVIEWGATKKVGPAATWTPGNTLAQAGQRLLTAWSSDCPPPKGRCAEDGGPFMGVFVQRAKLGGSLRWSDPRRMSQPKSHAERASIASDGQVAIAGWVTQRSYSKPRPGGPRTFYVRRSQDRGASWSHPIRLSPSNGRVDYPQVAVTDSVAFAVWTNADSGAIRLATSTDAGKTWTFASIGTTTAEPVEGQGLAGYPTVGASGSNLVVSRFADDAGTQVAKTSNVAGADLNAGSPEAVLTGPSANDGFHYGVARGAADGVSSDVALAYTTQDGIATRVFDGAVLRAEAIVVGGGWPMDIRGRSYAGATGPVVAPFGRGGLTVAFSACRDTSLTNDCRSTTTGARSDLLSSTSLNGGADWTPVDRIGLARGSKARINDAAGLVVTRPNKRFVLWNVRDERFLSSYRLALRIGSGMA